jgi:hypothetical protein
MKRQIKNRYKFQGHCDFDYLDKLNDNEFKLITEFSRDYYNKSLRKDIEKDIMNINYSLESQDKELIIEQELTLNKENIDTHNQLVVEKLLTVMSEAELQKKISVIVTKQKNH